VILFYQGKKKKMSGIESMRWKGVPEEKRHAAGQKYKTTI